MHSTQITPLLLGSIGAGKTTYSHQLKNIVDGILFSIVVWKTSLFLLDKTEKDGLE